MTELTQVAPAKPSNFDAHKPPEKKLIEDTRAQVERNIPRSTGDSFFRKLLFATFPFVKRLRLLALPMMIYQRSGLQKLVRASGLLRLLRKRLAQMEALLPRVP